MSNLKTVQSDNARIRHLLKLGIFAACLVMLGDILLGWGVSDPDVAEIPAVFTRYLSVSDARIIASALLGLIGIPVECLCWFAVYRLINRTLNPMPICSAPASSAVLPSADAESMCRVVRRYTS